MKARGPRARFYGVYGQTPTVYAASGMGMTEVRAASGVQQGTPGNWWSRTITPEGEVQHSERPASRNWSHAIGGGPIKKDARYWSHPIGQNPDNSTLRPLGAIDDMAEELPVTEPTDVPPVQPASEEPVSVKDPFGFPLIRIVSSYGDQELTNILNDAIAEGWRIKGCTGPYCMVQAERNREIRLVLLNEYRRRQAERTMPPLVEPKHTLAYSRYKLSKTVLTWADQTLTGRLLWPVKVYMKAGATALEDIVASEYLTIFIITSPLVGIYALRRLGYTGLGAILIGGYLGMTMGAMLPMTLFSLSQALGAAKEKDFLWAVS